MQDMNEQTSDRRPQAPGPDDILNAGETPGAELANDEAEAQPTSEGVEELRDRLLRTLAEMENVRNRSARDVEDARKYAVTGFARALLDVADNLARALAAVPPDARDGSEFVKNLVVGVEMTERALHGIFERHQIRRVAPQIGDRFDHARHQAMFELPTDAVAPGTVAEVMQPGYVIADRLLRPALVGVAKAPEGSAAASGGGSGAQIDVEA